MENVLKIKLNQLTNRCQILQKNVRNYKKGKYFECIQIMEEIVSIKKNLFVPKSHRKTMRIPQFCSHDPSSKTKVRYVPRFPQKGRNSCSKLIPLKIHYLQQFSLLLQKNRQTTYCSFISDSKIELSMQNPHTLPDTHLNLCAVLSQLDKHDQALQHAMLSIILLQDEFLQITLNKYKQQNELNNQRVAVLAIAYHNLGVQFQHLKRFEEAFKIYNKALDFSKTHLQHNQQLVSSLQKVVNSANEQMGDEKIKLFDTLKDKFQKQINETKKQLYNFLSNKKQKNLLNIREKCLNRQNLIVKINYKFNNQINKREQKKFSLKKNSKVNKSTKSKPVQLSDTHDKFKQLRNQINSSYQGTRKNKKKTFNISNISPHCQ